MFDIGFWEIAVIGGVALVVLGPERLPKVARTAGHLFGRLQRYVANVKTDIQREMDAADLAKMRAEFQEAAQTIHSTVQENVREFERAAVRLEQETAFAAVHPADTPLAGDLKMQQDILAAQDAALGIPAPPAVLAASDAAVSSIAPVVPATPAASVAVVAFDAQRQTLDFGVEPPRRLAP